MIYDAAIIGTGPAGVSAALNLKIRRKSFLWLGSRSLSDKVSKAEQILNYPGFPEADGKTLGEAFSAHIGAMGIEITEQMVNSIVPMGGHYALMAGSDFYEAKTVILACGVSAAGTLAGEERLLGKGVSYCATCDGNLYKGRTIAVVCNNKRFEHEVKFLCELASAVYYFPQYKGAEIEGGNVRTLLKKIEAVEGEGRVSALRLAGGETLEVDGVFCLRDSVSLSSLLPKLNTEEGHITVDRKMATNLPGVYAAGDCTGRPYQYAKAVGEGNVAAHSAIEYLAEKAACENS